MTYTMITTDIKDNVGIITLNRPEALNALCDTLVTEMGSALHGFEADDNIHVIMITGSEKSFAAGADIKEMIDKTVSDVYREDFITSKWEEVMKCRKVTIAAVSGYALGGGCELAMMCDMIIASDTAKFGQPEITIGTLPGAGGTQRLIRAIGKSKAMYMCLTGDMMSAQDMEKAGLVAKIVPASDLIEETLKTAQKIASFSTPVSMMVKEAVNKAEEMSLKDGLSFERRLFHASFGLEDRREGMQAFIDKRKADFKNK